MSKDVIDMACEESRWELLAEVISHVHRCIYSLEGDEISFYPSMCRVRSVGFWEFAIAVAVRLLPEECQIPKNATHV